MTKPEVRVRIAPSPSGYLHVGTARAAIFNYLFARRYDGKFLLRIENTDTERSDPAFIEPILSALQWLGMQWDEEIVYQADRLSHYADFANKLLESGHAYRCFCTKEELYEARETAKAQKLSLTYNRRCLGLTNSKVEQKLASGTPYVVRLKVPDGDVTFEDLVCGHLSRSSNDIEDLIVARSDGRATYNLAVVVDDHDMRISHVIRGNDHITNTFKQTLIYRTLGWKPPAFVHLPLILRPDKRKVSKRLNDKDVGQYRQEGILPEAIFNYLCLLGWSPKTDRELYIVDELTERFNLEGLNKANAIFDEDKLLAFNREYIMQRTDHQIAELAAPILIEAGVTSKYWLETRWEYLRAVMALLKPRLRRVSDVLDMGSYFFAFDGIYDPDAEEKQFSAEAAQRLTALSERFASLEEFTAATTEAALVEVASDLEIKKAQLIHPTRLAVSGRSTGPGLYDILAVLSKPTVIERINQAVSHILKKAATPQ